MPGVGLKRPEGAAGTSTPAASPGGDQATDPNIKLGKPFNPVPPADQFAQATVPPAADPAPTGTVPSARPMPPVGAPATAASPPIAVPVPGTSSQAAASPASPSSPNLVPRVDSYDEETYLCKSGDTLQQISKKFYNSEDYHLALLLFNRSHPRATATIWKDPPTLQEGQPIYVPPLRVLERQYAPVIPERKAAPAAAETTPATPWTTARSPQYRVRKPDETMGTIARDTLGNWERWQEIYQLNNRLDPSRPLPTGINLVMPADARIPPENKP
jgi:nucleoid-associated protein YgaU